jgi:hypothetical protein
MLDGETAICTRCFSVLNNVRALVEKYANCDLKAIYSYCSMLSGATAKGFCYGIVA